MFSSLKISQKFYISDIMVDEGIEKLTLFTLLVVIRNLESNPSVKEP